MRRARYPGLSWALARRAQRRGAGAARLRLRSETRIVGSIWRSLPRPSVLDRRARSYLGFDLGPQRLPRFRITSRVARWVGPSGFRLPSGPVLFPGRMPANDHGIAASGQKTRFLCDLDHIPDRCRGIKWHCFLPWTGPPGFAAAGFFCSQERLNARATWEMLNAAGGRGARFASSSVDRDDRSCRILWRHSKFTSSTATRTISTARKIRLIDFNAPEIGGHAHAALSACWRLAPHLACARSSSSAKISICRSSNAFAGRDGGHARVQLLCGHPAAHGPQYPLSSDGRADLS
jgi:hypothetical protein